MIAKIRNNEAGFTLIELLASVIVLVAVGSVIAGAISSSLRGTNKTNTIENIRQNGNYALNQMSKNIEYAQPFNGKNTGLSNDNGADAEYEASCANSLLPTPIPVTQYKFITVESADNKITQYNCDGSTLKANNEDLVDVNSVSLSNCFINCIQNKSTDIPIIKISFNLGPRISNNLVENSSPPIIFETSVMMKNYEK